MNRMLWILLLIQVVDSVWSGALLSPLDVHVDSKLTWSHPDDNRNVSYTAQYRDFDSEQWQDIPGCAQVRLTSCDFTDTKAEYGCVELRVRTEEHGRTSEPVEACSKLGDSCSPQFNLTARAGLMAVHLLNNHTMKDSHGKHASHLIYFGKEGEPLMEYSEEFLSLTIKDLEERVRYCVQVQFTLYGKRLGPPSCIQCQVIPVSEMTKYAKAVVSVVIILAVLVLVPVIAYILIYQRERIKEYIRPSCQLPESLSQPLPALYDLTFTPSEACDLITSFDIMDEGESVRENEDH